MECPRCGKESREGELICGKCQMPLIPGLSTKKLDKASGDVLQLPATGDTRLLDRMRLRFVVGDGKSFDVEMGEQLIIGRTVPGSQGIPDVDLTPYVGDDNEMGVSRFHCIIRRVGTNLTLQDSGSTNGTYLNGERLINGDPKFLHDGDNLFLAHLPLAIYYIL